MYNLIKCHSFIMHFQHQRAIINSIKIWNNYQYSWAVNERNVVWRQCISSHPPATIQHSSLCNSSTFWMQIGYWSAYLPIAPENTPCILNSFRGIDRFYVSPLVARLVTRQFRCLRMAVNITAAILWYGQVVLSNRRSGLVSPPQANKGC